MLGSFWEESAVETKGNQQVSLVRDFLGLYLVFCCSFSFLGVTEAVSAHVLKFSCQVFGSLSGVSKCFASTPPLSLPHHHHRMVGTVQAGCEAFIEWIPKLWGLGLS